MSFSERYGRKLGVQTLSGYWDASTNTPTIVSGVGKKNEYYIVSVSGSTEIDGISDWKVNDWIIFNGSMWLKQDFTDSVTSVAGKIGDVTLETTDINNFSTEVESIVYAIGSGSGEGLTTEIQNRIAGDAYLQQQLDTEVSRATNAESLLSTQITDEVNRALGAESALQTNIDDEESRALLAESNLQGQITQEIADRIADVDAEEVRATNAELAIASDLTQEISDRIADVDAEETRATNIEIILQNQINQEIIDRTADVDAEESRALAAEGILTADLAAEVIRATGAEEAIASDLAQEVLDRVADVDAEETRALGVELSLQNQITQEISDRITDVNAEESRAIAAESILQSNIDAEETRALAAEGVIAANLAQEILDRAADVDAEEARALAAENVLQSNIDTEEAARIAEDLTFLKLDGSRNMTGNLNLSSNSIDAVSNISTENISVSLESTTKKWVTTPNYVVATTNGTVSLNSSSSTVHFITGSASNFTVILPDARTLDNGTNYEIYNRTSSSIVIKCFDGSTLGILDSEAVSSLILQDNSTDCGVFSPFTVEIAQAAGILNYNLQSQTSFVASSNIDTQITSFTLTPTSGEYYISYNASNIASTNNAECTVSLYKNETQITGTERTARSTASNFILLLSTQGVASFNGTDILSVYVRTTTGSLTVGNRSVIMLRLGGMN